MKIKKKGTAKKKPYEFSARDFKYSEGLLSSLYDRTWDITDVVDEFGIDLVDLTMGGSVRDRKRFRLRVDYLRDTLDALCSCLTDFERREHGTDTERK